MAKEKPPVTAAIRVLRSEKVAFSDHLYDYEEKGGTASSSRELGVPEHSVIKTLIMEDDQRRPLVVLMHGDMQVSTRELARQTGVKQVVPCTPEVAAKHTGYLVGGTSPFGTRRSMPVYIEEGITRIDRIYINGGKRGYLVCMETKELIRVLAPTVVNVGIGKE